MEIMESRAARAQLNLQSYSHAIFVHVQVLCPIMLFHQRYDLPSVLKLLKNN